MGLCFGCGRFQLLFEILNVKLADVSLQVEASLKVADASKSLFTPFPRSWLGSMQHDMFFSRREGSPFASWPSANRCATRCARRARTFWRRSWCRRTTGWSWRADLGPSVDLSVALNKSVWMGQEGAKSWRNKNKMVLVLFLRLPLF